MWRAYTLPKSATITGLTTKLTTFDDGCVCVHVQACHDVVPPDWLQPVIRHLCNQFIHDRARPEEIVVGLKTVREICMRMPLVMSEELLLVRLWHLKLL